MVEKWDRAVKEVIASRPRRQLATKKNWAGNCSLWDDVLTDGHIALLRRALVRTHRRLEELPGKEGHSPVEAHLIQSLWKSVQEDADAGLSMRVERTEERYDPAALVFVLDPAVHENGDRIYVDAEKFLLAYQALEPDSCVCPGKYRPVIFLKEQEIVGCVMPLRGD